MKKVIEDCFNTVSGADCDAFITMDDRTRIDAAYSEVLPIKNV